MTKKVIIWGWQVEEPAVKEHVKHNTIVLEKTIHQDNVYLEYFTPRLQSSNEIIYENSVKCSSMMILMMKDS